MDYTINPTPDGTEDLTGRIFGKWTVLGFSQKKPNGNRWWCKCECGTVKEKPTAYLSGTRGASAVTGCRNCARAAKAEDLTGRTFGQFTVLRRGETRVRTSAAGNTNRQYLWVCLCSCGRESSVSANNLRQGGSTKCEECRRDEMREGTYVLKHGGSTEFDEGIVPSYYVWKSIMARCFNPNQPGYKYYGGDGVTMCKRWKEDYSAFRDDMGPRPSWKHSIDRANDDESTKHYSCGSCPECVENGWVSHCRWADAYQQNQNKKRSILVTIDGETKCVAEWCRITGMNPTTVTQRIHRGWDPVDAVTKPPRKPSG